MGQSPRRPKTWQRGPHGLPSGLQEQPLGSAATASTCLGTRHHRRSSSPLPTTPPLRCVHRQLSMQPSSSTLQSVCALACTHAGAGRCTLCRHHSPLKGAATHDRLRHARMQLSSATQPHALGAAQARYTLGAWRRPPSHFQPPHIAPHLQLQPLLLYHTTTA